MPETDNLDALVSAFTQKLRAEIESQTYDRLQAAIASLRAANPDAFVKGTAAALSLSRRTGKPVSAARKLQGQYIGALRTLQGAERARVQSIARSKGVPAALKVAAKIFAQRAAVERRAARAQAGKTKSGRPSSRRGKARAQTGRTSARRTKGRRG